MEVYTEQCDRANGSETGRSGRLRTLERFPKEVLSVHIWKIFPIALVSLPHTTSHISSASPVRMFSSDTKIKTVGISPFLLPYSCIEKYVVEILISFFFIPDVFFVDPESVSICSYMCWASIMSKYLASMI